MGQHIDVLRKDDTGHEMPSCEMAAPFNLSGKKDAIASGACKHGYQTVESGKIDESGQEDHKKKYYPLTLELKNNSLDSILERSQALSNGVFNPQEPFCIVGLHTCGDLAANVVRLFLQSPTAGAMSVVGCCYHHITECDEGNVVHVNHS